MKIFLAFFTLFLARYIQLKTRLKVKKTKPTRSLIVLGSGGHTSEMIRLLKTINESKFEPRLYIHADTDKLSPTKLSESGNYSIKSIPRSRQVGQSWISSFFSTLFSLLYCIFTVTSFMPDVVVLINTRLFAMVQGRAFRSVSFHSF